MGLFSDLFGSNSGSKQAARVAQATLDWQKQQVAQDRADRAGIVAGLQPQITLANTVDQGTIGELQGLAGDSRARGNTLWNSYINNVAPVESKFYKEALDYGGEADQASAAGEAVSDVRQQAGIQRQMNQRQMTSMGINPNSGRFASQDRMAQLLEMAAAAGGATKARKAQRDAGIQLRKDATQIGQNTLNASGTFSNAAIGSNNAASSVANNGVARGLQVGEFKVGGLPTYMSGVGNASNAAATAYNNTNTTGLLPGALGVGASFLTAPTGSWAANKMTEWFPAKK